MKPSLAKILAYQNENIISRFTDKYNIIDDEAVDIFNETKKFLYLTHFDKVFITNDIVILDEMWHNFILFTNEYHDFCQANFGKFKHHLPTSKAEKQERTIKFQENPEKSHQEALIQFEWLLGITYDHLGSHTVEKWFEVYPEKYSREQVKILMK